MSTIFQVEISAGSLPCGCIGIIPEDASTISAAILHTIAKLRGQLSQSCNRIVIQYFKVGMVFSLVQLSLSQTAGMVNTQGLLGWSMNMRQAYGRMIRWLWLFVMAISATFGVNAAEFGVAGVPVALGKLRDYNSIFATLKASGVSIYFPTSQYEEQPAAKALGTEPDFLTPCSASSPAFDALRRHKMRLLIAGELLYGRGQGMPSLDADPLRQIIECAGRSQVYGILSYDEPVSSGASIKDVARLFDRIKEIDPTLPVLMVHAPVVLDKPEFASLPAQAAYLDKVKSYSFYADFVGFDVYPIVKEIAQIGSPASGGAMVGYVDAVKDHLKWLRDELPDHGFMMVLQGFSYADQYEPNFLRTIAPQEMLDAVRPPNLDETMEMAQLSISGGAELVIWWGLSFQKDGQSPIWRDVLSAVRTLSGAQ